MQCTFRVMNWPQNSYVFCPSFQNSCRLHLAQHCWVLLIVNLVCPQLASLHKRCFFLIMLNIKVILVQYKVISYELDNWGFDSWLRQDFSICCLFHAGCKHQGYCSMGNGCSVLRSKVSKLEFLFYVCVVY